MKKCGKQAKPGEYHIIVSAENPDGTSDPVRTIVVLEGEAEKRPWDVNGDGEVDISDLVLVGSNFGKEVENITGDVNGDDVVDISDLVLVGSHFGESIAVAPKFTPHSEHSFSHPDTAVLRQLHQRLSNIPTPNADVTFVMRLLEGLLSESPPCKTKLLPNFLNPFNPETWLPYQLAENASVSISIYNAKGQLIRTLHTGDRKAGMYVTKGRTAYWDGKDSLGEKVSSGVYYYSLQAREFTATRKMAILK